MIVQQDDGWKISESDTFFFFFLIFEYSVHSSSEYIIKNLQWLFMLKSCLTVKCCSAIITILTVKLFGPGGFMKLQFCFALF